ncbi:MAG: efflux RND transporter periplasmic adaptor subunit [Rhizobiales bacterium]|nr:efflux RND transporter periplasmic adaptor subunit [Hyphomicrobiales bacterium]
MAFDGSDPRVQNITAQAKGLVGKRPVQIGLAALILLALVWWGYSSFSSSETLTYKTAQATTGNIENAVTALGSLQPLNYVDVGAQVSGQLTKVYVDIGDQVEKGKLLAEIDPLVYQSQVDSDNARIANLEAQLKSAQADVTLCEKQFVRYRDLLKTNAVSRDLYDQALNKLQTTRASIDSLKAQIKEQQATLSGDTANLGYTKIYAPMSGTVVSQTTQEGQTVVSSQSAPTIVRIADLETMTAEAQVAEADVDKLTVGMKAYFTTLGMPDKKWESSVRQIQPTPTIENNVVLFNVLLDVKNEQNLLLPDMTAQVFFIISAAKDAVIVPLSAVKTDHNGTYVMLERNGKPVRQAVEVGVSNRVSAEITSGVSTGDTIITSTATTSAKSATSSGSRGMPPMF